MKPYPEQLEIVDACAKAGRGSISACTGFGKSYTMALLVARMQVKTLIVVPNVTLRDQLRADMLGFFGTLDNLTIENIQNPDLKNHKDYGMLIIDEAHHSAAASYRQLNRKAWGGIYYRFFFSATCFRSNEDELLLYESIAGSVIYRIDYLKARDLGYVAPVDAYFVELPKRPVEGFTWQQVYKELVVDNEHRNGVIAALLEAFSGCSTLCLVKEIAHGENLPGFYFAHGQNEDTKHLITLFNRGTLKVLVGTTGVLGEGVDTKPCENVVIAGLGKSKTQFMQQVGRAVRRYPGKESAKVIIFKDLSHKWSAAHFKAQVKILKEEYGVIPVKLDLT